MANPLHFCFESLAQFADWGAMAPFSPVGGILRAVMDVCDADTSYQTTTARQDEREDCLKREAELADKFKTMAGEQKRRHGEREQTLAEIIMAMKKRIEELERQQK